MSGKDSQLSEMRLARKSLADAIELAESAKYWLNSAKPHDYHSQAEIVLALNALDAAMKDLEKQR